MVLIKSYELRGSAGFMPYIHRYNSLQRSGNKIKLKSMYINWQQWVMLVRCQFHYHSIDTTGCQIIFLHSVGNLDRSSIEYVYSRVPNPSCYIRPSQRHLFCPIKNIGGGSKSVKATPILAFLHCVYHQVDKAWVDQIVSVNSPLIFDSL